MDFKSVGQEEIYELIGQEHTQVVGDEPQAAEQFQNEIRSVYEELVRKFAAFGREGDYYGTSDFAVRPSLKERLKIMADAPPFRQFSITVLSKKFWRSSFLRSLSDLLCDKAPDYRIIVAQDFDPQWSAILVLTTNSARLWCTDLKEISRISSMLQSSPD